MFFPFVFELIAFCDLREVVIFVFAAIGFFFGFGFTFCFGFGFGIVLVLAFLGIYSCLI